MALQREVPASVMVSYAAIGWIEMHILIANQRTGMKTKCMSKLGIKRAIATWQSIIE